MDAAKRRKRFKELQVINNRKNLIRELSPFVRNVTIESFLEIDKTVELAKKVYEKIDTIPNQQKFIKEKNVAIEKLLNIKGHLGNLINNKVVLFHYYDRDAGALIIELNDFFNNVDWNLDFIKFTSEDIDLMLVGMNLEFGICIECHEYQNNLITWGF